MNKITFFYAWLSMGVSLICIIGNMIYGAIRQCFDKLATNTFYSDVMHYINIPLMIFAGLYFVLSVALVVFFMVKRRKDL